MGIPVRMRVGGLDGSDDVESIHASGFRCDTEECVGESENVLSFDSNDLIKANPPTITIRDEGNRILNGCIIFSDQQTSMIQTWSGSTFAQ